MLPNFWPTLFTKMQGARKNIFATSNWAWLLAASDSFLLWRERKYAITFYYHLLFFFGLFFSVSILSGRSRTYEYNSSDEKTIPPKCDSVFITTQIGKKSEVSLCFVAFFYVHRVVTPPQNTTNFLFIFWRKFRLISKMKTRSEPLHIYVQCIVANLTYYKMIFAWRFSFRFMNRATRSRPRLSISERVSTESPVETNIIPAVKSLSTPFLSVSR